VLTEEQAKEVQHYYSDTELIGLKNPTVIPIIKKVDVLLAVEGFKKEMAAKPFRSFGDIKRGLERWFG
jgi:hypothetical protein